MTRLAIVSSHPIQYYAPLFREIATRVDLHVFFAHKATARQQGDAGFGGAFDWDVDLLSGYAHSFLRNISADPRTDRFPGCDTPEVGQALTDGGFDVVLVLGWHLKTFVQTVIAARRQGRAVMVRGDSQLATPRSAVKRLGKRAIYPALLRSFNAALFVGQRSRAYYEHYGYPAERLFFSPHCVDTGWFGERGTPAAGRALRAKLGIGAQEKVALFAGKLSAFKRPLDLVEACARAPLFGTHVVVAGSGALEAAMRERAKALGVTLHMLGFQNQTSMPPAYAAANALVLPSDGRETWGLVANEALACGTPIVVSEAAGCASDLAADGVAGRRFRLGDIDDLAQVLAGAFTAPPPRFAVEMKSNAYSLEAAADGVDEATAAVLARRSRRRTVGAS